MNKSYKKIVIADENLPYLLNGISYPTGGASVQTSNWVQGFKEKGYTSVVFSSVNVQNNSEYIIEFSPERKGLKNPFALLKVAIKFYKILVKHRPKFIYISIPFWYNFVFVLPARILEVKTIQRVSNDDLVPKRAKNRFNKFSKIKYFLYVLSLKNSSVILGQNSYQEENFKLEFPNKLVLKLHNPFLYKANNIEKKRKYVAWIGLFQYQKNLPALYKIAKNLPDIPFKIAGKYVIIDNETSLALNKLERLKNVTFVGLLSQSEISNFLSEAYCLLNTSRYEGFSNTYLEALSVGTPVITRKETDPDGIIEKNNLGLAANNYEEIPFLLEKTVNMGFKNKRELSEYVKKNHSPIALVDKLLKCI